MKHRVQRVPLEEEAVLAATARATGPSLMIPPRTGASGLPLERTEAVLMGELKPEEVMSSARARLKTMPRTWAPTASS
jgi:hypothetical protein